MVMDMLIQALTNTAEVHGANEAHRLGLHGMKATEWAIIQSLMKTINMCGMHSYFWEDK